MRTHHMVERGGAARGGSGARRCGGWGGGFGMMIAASIGLLGTSPAFALLRPPPEGAKQPAELPARQPRPLERPIHIGDSAPGEPAPAQPVDPNAPRAVIACAEPTHDFGTVWIGPMLKHTFTVKNEGAVPLEISAVKPSCGCTIAGPYPKKIEAGQVGEFPFSVDSTKLGAKFEKAVTITSNDPVTPSFRLRLRGEVKRYIEVMPQSIQFGKLFGDEPQERVVKINSNMETPLELTLGEKPGDNFDVQLTAVTPGKAFDLKVTTKPPYEAGIFRRTITLNTNADAQKEIKIECQGSVPERLEVNPAVLVLGSPASKGTVGDKELTRVVRFTNYGNKPVKILEAKPSESVVTAEVVEETAGKVYTVNIKFPANYAPPAEGAVVALKTDDDQKPSIDLPIKSWGPPPGSEPTAAANAPKPAEELVGQKAGEFSLKTTDGKSLASADLPGKITVLDFFANNCGFCKKQIPRLEAVRAEYTDKGVRFVAVSQTMRDKKYTDEETIDTLKQAGWRGEVATDPDNKVGPLFRATSYPTMAVVGKTGVIEAVNLGNLADLESRLKGQLDAMIAGKAVPKPEATAKATPPPAPKVELVGKPAPQFSLTTFDGKSIANADLEKSGATVLNFVATNCGFCKKQIPRLETVRKEYVAKGVRFVNVVETMRTPSTREQIEEKMKEMGSGLEVAHDPDNKVGPLFNATGFPTMVVVGKGGNVEAVNVGNVEDLESRLKGQLDAVLAGKPVPQVAATPPAAKPEAPKADAANPEAPKADAAKPAPPPSLVGRPAPPISLQTFAGKSVSNADFPSAPATVLNFVAGNCGYCKKQIPRLEKLRETYAEKGVRFVNVVETMRQEFSKEEIEKIMGEVGSKLEVAQDPKNTLGQPYNATGFPTMVVVGRSGKVEAINVGNIADLEKRVAGQLDALIAGKPIPAEFAAAPPPASSKRPAEELAGKPAPTLVLSTIDGKSVSNEDFKKGPATVLNFFAPNCGFCKKQIPTVEAIRKEYESKGIRFVNVAQKMGTKEFTLDEIKDVLKQAGSNLELAASDYNANAVGQAFKATSYPTMFVVDKEGKVAHVNVGAKGDLDKLLKEQLDALIAGKTAAAPAAPTGAGAAPAGTVPAPAAPPLPTARP